MQVTSAPKRLAVSLLVVTLVYNVFEGVISLVPGMRAHSLTLIAFGIDSYVEVLAAAAVLWRLSYKDDEEGEQAEAKALRLIGVTFMLLAAGVTFEAIVSLSSGKGAETSALGILVLALSLTLMPALSIAKLWLAAKTGMGVIAAEAKETVACSYLSFTALGGLVAVALFGWVWLDAVTALLMVPWLVREGMEGLRGEACFEGVRPCFCGSCFFGLRNCAGACCLPPGTTLSSASP